MKKQKTSFYSRYGKRGFDLMLTIPGIVLVSPILASITFLIRFKMGRPIFFRQIRPGLHGSPFMLYKIRTMAKDTPSRKGNQLSDAERLTGLGNFLRNTSLDELPELWNVLKNDMSLVGPRPLLMEYLNKYNQEQFRRHEVRPGITGWAQVNGRNSLSWEEKFKFDVWYVDNQSFWLDVKILFLTLWKVLKRENISPDGRSTVDKFMGNEDDV